MHQEQEYRADQGRPEVRSKARALAQRLQRMPIGYRLLGLWSSRHFTRHGWISCVPGFPLLRVRNLGGALEAGNCLFYPGVRLEVGRGARLAIGTGTYLNRDTEIIAWQEVTIGVGCMIGWDVLIMDTDQHPTPRGTLENRPVHIGDHVWIGARATILKGVRIGNGAVIGACAVVTHDVPAGAVVVGPSATVRGT